MIKQIKKRANNVIIKGESNDKRFALITSILITIVIFSIFFAQVVFSDILTFEKNGDNLKLCFPALIKLGEYINNGRLNGVDVGTFNGATEFFFRSNLPNMYIPAILIAKIMQVIPKGFAYLLFYMLHMSVALYFSQVLVQRFFKLNKWISLLFSICVGNILLYENWYLSFYIIAALTCPLLYFSLCSLENNKKYKFLLYSIPYVMAFTSGYVTVSFALVGMCVIVTLFYGIIFLKNTTRKQIIVKALIPPFIAGSVNFLYCYEVFDYVKNVVHHASSTIYDTLYYNFNIKNLPMIISSSFTSVNLIEQMLLITIGVIWCMVIFIMLYSKGKHNIIQEHKYTLMLGGISNLVILLIALGMTTPLTLWFYSFVPIFGSMHLPLRYLMITQPLLYIALCLCIQYLPELKNKDIFKRLSLICFSLAVVICLVSQYYEPKSFYSARMILELLIVGVIFYSIFFHGINSKVTIILWCISIILPGLNFFYQNNEVNIMKYTFKERSIVYNEDYEKTLDGFITTLDNKDLYRFAAFDSIDSVPNFIPNNYEWFGYSKFNLSNYMGYEPQLASPNDYSAKFGWFNQMDWNYIVNTRGDFLILDDKSIQDNAEFLNIIVDWDYSNNYIDGKNRLLKLKKFIPSHYNGTNYIEDNPNSMDNGYFYSHDLRNDALLEFDTDDATYYTAKINASVRSEISFLLYPNRMYQYYLDDVKIEPVIDNMQVFIPISTGVHTIKVIYENKINNISNYIFLLYYFSIIICILYSIFLTFRNRLYLNSNNNKLK